MTEISPDEFGKRWASNDEELYVLDIRHEEEYEAWNIPGSVNVDVYDELAAEPETVPDQLETVPTDKEIVTVCAAGVLSATATELLCEEDYDAKTLVDGMNGWSRVHRHARVDVELDGTLVQVARPGKGCLSHVLVSEGEAVLFDPSQYVDEYEAILAEYDAELVGVFDTHAHADHVSGGPTLADRHDVPYHLHPADAEEIDAAPLADEETFHVGAVEVTTIHTPGHSPGGVTFAVENEALLTGDTLFYESVGRVELGVAAGLEDTDVESNAETLYESLQRLQKREGDTVVLPAHDPGSPEPPAVARLRDLLQTNDDLGRERDAFVAELSSDIPQQPLNFQRIKRVNTGLEQVPDEELTDLESGPSRCAAE